MTKVCINCKIEKDIVNFRKRKDNKDGFRNDCKLCQKKRDASLYSKNRESRRAQQSEYYNLNVQAILEQKSKYGKENPDKVNAISMKKYASKMQRMPSWLTKEQIGNIQKFYTKAKILSKKSGINFEVDHIVPLQGKNVSGLHVPWNLQILTEVENIKKGNRI